MTEREIELLEIAANAMLRVADAEGWAKTDIARITAELALKAVEQLKQK